MMALVLGAASLFGADVTGTWKAAVETDAGSGNPVFHLKQDAEKLTGTYSGALGEAKVTGTIKGSEVTLEFDAQVHVVYRGKLGADGKTMSGAVDLGGQATGTFQAAKE